MPACQSPIVPKGLRSLTPALDVHFSRHALLQAQRRGVRAQTLRLVLEHHDRSRKVPGLCRALWISPRRRKALVQSGIAAREVERASGVRLIIHIHDDVVFTVEHTTARRRWI